MKINRLFVLPALAVVFAAWWAAAQTAPKGAAEPIVTVPGMPPVIDPTNLYSETVAGKMSPVVADAVPRVYVPNRRSNTVTVIDPATLQVVDTYKVGRNPQHVVPSWDLKTLWVANNAEGRTDGSLTPIDPTTARPGEAIPVDDPYNLYWTPDGHNAIVVAEEHKRLSRSADDEARILGQGAQVRRYQPCRLLDRR
jgi:YVTN family beta-propeller protein